MQLKITKQFQNGNFEVIVEDSDEKKALMKAVFFLEPDICRLCSNTQIRWMSNKAQTDDGEFIYIKRMCRKCGATSTMGDYKSGGHFWKNWEERYTKDDLKSQESPQKTASIPPKSESKSDEETFDPNDIPF